MSFSELSLIADDIGMMYSAEKSSLYGKLCGIDTCVLDSGNYYIVTMFVKIPLKRENEVSVFINSLAESMPKNTVNRQFSEVDYLGINLTRDNLLQENAELLVEFLEKLADFLSKNEFEKTALNEKAIPVVNTVKQPVKKKRKRLRTAFDKYSLRGIIGSVIGAAACLFIAGMSINVDSATMGYQIWSWIFGAAIALIILVDYYFLAKKFDVAGTIVSTLLTFIAITGGTAMAAIHTLSGLIETETGAAANITEVLSNISVYIGKYPEVGEMGLELLLKGYFVAAVASVLFYRWYFTKHGNEMYVGDSDEIAQKK